MELQDKFGIVIKSNTQSLKLTHAEIENYFENLIKNNTEIFLSSIVYKNFTQYEEFDNKIIINNLTDYVKEIRKNLRKTISKTKLLNNDTSLINTFNTSLKNYSNKITQLEYFIDNSEFKSKCYNIFLSLVLSDPMLKIVFQKELMDVSLQKDMKQLMNNIKIFEPEFYNTWCFNFIKQTIETFSNSQSVFISTEFPIPDNILHMYEFAHDAKFISDYKKHFSFINEDNIFESPVGNLLDKIYLVAESNKIEVFNVFIKNNYSIFEKYVKPNLSKEQIDNFEINFVVKVYQRYKKTETLENLCEFYLNISKYFTQIFPYSVTVITKDLSKFILENNLIDQLSEILFDNLKQSNKNIEDDKISYIFNIISYFDDKNIIFKKYHNELMLRILKDNLTVENLAFEKLLVTRMSKCFNCRQLYVLNKTIEDVQKSIESKKYVSGILEGQNKLIGIPDKWNIINTSYNIWDSTVFDIDTKTDTFEQESCNLAKFLKFYSQVYSKTHSESRNLNWYLHTGSVEISYDSNHGRVNLKLLPLQALVLEKFDISTEYMTLEQYFKLDVTSSYSRKEKEKILDVFIENKILNLVNDKLYLNLEHPGCKELNLIEKFFEVSSMPEVWRREEEIQLANEKEDIVKTKINHHLKQKDLNKEKLFELCQDINVFKLDENLFDKAIKSMINFDYIKFDDSSKMYSKLLF